MKLTIGYSLESKLGEQQVVEARDGVPIKIEGLELELTVHAEEGYVEVRGTGVTYPVLRAMSSNVFRLTPETMADVEFR